jgi:IclR family KDG regulon transcriptional repressor
MRTQNSSSASGSDAPRVAENRSASRVLDVLDLFLHDGACYTLKEVSERLVLPKSTTHGILHEMRRHGYLTLDPVTKTYAVSLRLVGRMAATPAIEIVRHRAHRHLERLVAMLGETAKLIAYERTHSVAIDYVDGPGPLKYAVTLGQRWPLHATGGGKLYLAQFDDARVREILTDGELERVTPKTIVDVDALVGEVAEVRRQGWARQREEIHEGISGFAAPVHDSDGNLLAALIVMGPTARVEENEAAIVKAIVAEGHALSVDVGALDPAEPDEVVVA